MSTSPTHVCLYCQSTSDQVPLLQIEFRGRVNWICSQHLPVLIHKPQELEKFLAGAENLASPELED